MGKNKKKIKNTPQKITLEFLDKELIEATSLAEDNHFHTAIEKLEHIKKLTKTEALSISLQEKHSFLAKSYFASGVYHKLLHNYKNALVDLAEALDFEPKQMKINVAIQRLSCYQEILQQSSNVKEKYQLTSLHIIKELSLLKESLAINDQQWSQIYYYAACCFNSLSEYTQSNEYASLGKAYALHIKDNELYIQNLSLLASNSFYLNEAPEKTIQLVNHAILSAKNLKLQPSSLFNAYFAGIMACFKLDPTDYKKVIEYAENALKITLPETPKKFLDDALCFAKLSLYAKTMEYEKAIIEGLSFINLKSSILNVYKNRAYYSLAYAYYHLENYSKAIEYANLKNLEFEEPEDTRKSKNEIILMASYLLKDYQTVIKCIPEDSSSVNSNTVLLTSFRAAHLLNDKKAIEKISKIIEESSSNHELVTDYQTLTSLLLSMDAIASPRSAPEEKPSLISETSDNSEVLKKIKDQESECVIQKAELEKEILHSQQTTCSQNTVEALSSQKPLRTSRDRRQEKIEKKLKKILAKEFIFFKNPLYEAQKTELTPKTDLIRMSGPFLSKKKSNIYCQLELSEEIELFKNEYPQAFHKLEGYLNTGEICAAQNEQGIKYLTDSVKIEGHSYHWEVKIKGKNGNGDLRLLGRKTSEDDGKTVIIFDMATGHKGIKHYNKIK